MAALPAPATLTSSSRQESPMQGARMTMGRSTPLCRRRPLRPPIRNSRYVAAVGSAVGQWMHAKAVAYIDSKGEALLVDEGNGNL